MSGTVERSWIEELLRRDRYLVLATTDGSRPWIAPLERVLDGPSARIPARGHGSRSSLRARDAAKAAPRR